MLVMEDDMKRKTRNIKKYDKLPNPADSWAKVELYRWQHGELPGDKPLNESKALLAMADAIEKGCKENNREIMPSSFNVVSVMRYIAKKL